MTDTNTKSGEDSRLKRSTERTNQADQVSPTRLENMDPVRRSMRRDQFLVNILPNPPEIKGFHTIWLSTTNTTDTIANRMNLGYVPVKPAEVPDWDHMEVKSGDWHGMIGCREMILFKLPLQLYEDYMKELYHDAPLEEENKIEQAVDTAKAIAGNRSKIQVGDGMIANRAAAPLFHEQSAAQRV